MPHRLSSILNRQNRRLKIGQKGSLSATVLTSIAEVTEIADDWRHLHSLCEGPSIFQNFDWCLTWLETVNSAEPGFRTPRIIRIDEPSGEPVAILPLCDKNRGTFSYAEWIGEPLIQYGDILLSPGADDVSVREALIAIPELWEGLRALHLRKVRADARIHSIIPLCEHGATETTLAAIANLEGPADADAYLARQSSRTRKTRRSRRRKLSELGNVDLKIYEPGPVASAVCETAIGWKAEWLRKSGQTSRAFASPISLDAIIKTLGPNSSDTGVRVIALTLDEKPIAVEIAFVDPKTIYAFMGAFDPDYERFGVGNLQIEDTIRHAFEQGINHYDLLAPMTDYKTSWTNSEMAVSDYVVPIDIVGEIVIYGYYRHARPLAKSTYGALPDWVRKPILHIMNL